MKNKWFYELQESLNNLDLDTSESLLRRGINVNETSEGGFNLLSFFIEQSNERSLKEIKNVIELLLNHGLNLSYKSDKGFSCLHDTVFYSNYNAAKVLIDVRVNVNEVDNLGRTALWHAISNYRDGNEKLLEIIKLLLSSGADLDIENQYGISPRDILLTRHERISKGILGGVGIIDLIDVLGIK